MFANQLSIGKIVAHSAIRTEAMQARLRISHLLQTADFAPPGFPPQSILIVRHARSPNSISLASFRLRSQWEQSVRENITRLYRTAVRPVGGMVPAGAQAVLFADTGEWLACMGRAVHAGELDQTWYREAFLRSKVDSSSSALARAWFHEPRSVPAAIAHLAAWSRVVKVLQLFSPAEANAIFAAVAAEWNLPKQNWDLPRLSEPAAVRAQLSPKQPPDKRDLPVAGATIDHSRARGASQTDAKDSRTISSLPGIDRDRRHALSVQPPWQIWCPALGESCAGLPAESQRLLAVAVALFHAPALVRSANFALQVQQWLLAISELRQAEAPQSMAARRSPKVTWNSKALPARDYSLVAAVPIRDDGKVSPAATSGVQEVGSKPGESATRVAAKPAPVDLDRERSPGAIESAASENESSPCWLNLSGCETRIGGVLFLINLIQQTGLPECFDEELNLSQHISGWGLVETLGKALLGPMLDDFHDDPLWTILQRLDGRSPGEMPATSLPPIDEYRMPREWLQRFVSPAQPWAVDGSPDRFRLGNRAGAFVIVDCLRRPLSIAGQANLELERYRAHGIIATFDQGGPVGPVANDPFVLALWLIPEWKNLPGPLQSWIRWTFPFLRYLLVRVLGDEASTPAGLARRLLLKTGTLYCTATHIDLVMRMDQIALAVRRAGLDANPGWLLDLRRAVSFHYE